MFDKVIRHLKNKYLHSLNPGYIPIGIRVAKIEDKDNAWKAHAYEWIAETVDARIMNDESS